MLTLNMIPTQNKNTIRFKQRVLPYCLLHDLEIVTVNGGESTSQYHTPLPVAKFTGKPKKIKYSYFIATPRIHKTLKGETGYISMHLEDMLLSFHTNSRTVPQNQTMIIFFCVPAFSLFTTSPVTVYSLNY